MRKIKCVEEVICCMIGGAILNYKFMIYFVPFWYFGHCLSYLNGYFEHFGGNPDVPMAWGVSSSALTASAMTIVVAMFGFTWISFTRLGRIGHGVPMPGARWRQVDRQEPERMRDRPQTSRRLSWQRAIQ